MAAMYNPAHPGEVLRELYLKPLGLTVMQAAAALGITRKALSELINGKRAVTPVMALRLEKAFASSADHWLRMQQNCDLWHARRTARLSRVRRMVSGPLPASG